MESSLDGAQCLLGKVLSLLTDELVAAYVAISKLGPRFDAIRGELMSTQALLELAQMRGVSDNDSGLQGLLGELRKKADEFEDVLDELHYNRIRDKLDGTSKFDPWVPDDLRGQVIHGRHAVGNCFSCFSCSSTQDDADGVDDVLNNPNKAKSGNGHDVDHLDRVAMSNKIKVVIEGMQSLCETISPLLTINPNNNPVAGSMGVTMGEQRVTSSMIQWTNKLYGRHEIFSKTIRDMTSGITHHETLCVLPIFGIGGVGKTTLAQHLYSHQNIKEHFRVRAWVCVSTNFNVRKLTKGILECIPAEQSDDSNRAHESNYLDQLHQSIVKRLKSKRFLIVLDDIWECTPRQWKDLLAPLKESECEKGSMVLVTTRKPRIAQDIKTNNSIHLEGLESSDIMAFFEEYVFDQAPAGYDHECMIEIARQIAPKLKGSPLAATTVGRLLKWNFSQDHWKRILERQEWLDEKDADGILPALKISYNYLPIHLKECFLYFGLFPEDFRFHKLNIIQFWDAIGIIHSNEKPEVTGLKYLDEFVDRGFLVKECDESNPSYVMHDLLHELSQRVSSHECANISTTSLRAYRIPKSIRHLSITIEESDVGDFGKEMQRLRGRVDIEHLRSLMIFGDTSASTIHTILQKTLGEIKRLRVLSIILRSDESWPQDLFGRLIHLRYLRISYPYPYRFSDAVASLPTTISTLHHLKFLEINSEYFNPLNLPINFTRLVDLRHFVADGETHSNVPKFGELEYLQELKEFHVKKESDGFELDQLGKLYELGGKLCICGLEKVETKEEASKADLRWKKNLHELTLQWARASMRPDQAADVIDGLEPHPNLRKLSIECHPGAIGPRWLCHDICTTSLESLRLNSISWNVLPPLGLLPRLKELGLSEIAGMSQFGPDYPGVTENSFPSLETILFESMPDLVKWVGGANHHFFSRLETIDCSDCPKLSGLPFSERTDPSKQVTNTLWFPHLCSLFIARCPELTLHPLPHTSLESLHLVRISWNVFPPLGLLPRLKELRLSEIAGISQFGPDLGGVTEESSISLKTILFESMPDLVKWVGGANHHFFSRLERIECSDCPKLSELPFSDCIDPSEQETNTVWFPNLCSLSIPGCPELSLPPLPHTPTLIDVQVLNHANNGMLEYKKCSLNISKYGGALDFDNLDKVEKFWIRDAPQISLTDLQKLHSLRYLSIHEFEIDFLFSGDNLVLSSVKELSVKTLRPIGKLLPRVLQCFPDILELNMSFFKNEAEHEEQVLPQFPSFSSLSKVTIEWCRNLVLPLEDGRGCGDLTSIESLEFYECGKIFSRWSTCDGSDHRIVINPFPASLKELRITGEPSMRSMDLIQNLTSLTHLCLIHCHNLTVDVDRFNPDITLNLKRLFVFNYGENRSVAADLFREVAKRNPLAMGFFGHLEHLCVDSIAAVLVDPICKLLSAKLRTLEFDGSDGMERFTEEQDKALQQLASLEELRFSGCPSLQCLPEGLHRLRSLKRMELFDCYGIRSFPQNGLPTSLEKLMISKYNSKELLEEAYKLSRWRYPNLVISSTYEIL